MGDGRDDLRRMGHTSFVQKHKHTFEEREKWKCIIEKLHCDTHTYTKNVNLTGKCVYNFARNKRAHNGFSYKCKTS